MIKTSSMNKTNGASTKSKFFKGFHSPGATNGTMNTHKKSAPSTMVKRLGLLLLVAAVVCCWNYVSILSSMFPSFLIPSSSLSSRSFTSRPSSSLVLIPMIPYHNCWGGFVKTVCETTYLIENLDIMPIPQSASEESLRIVCDYLWKIGGTADIAHAPVCFQNSDTIGMLASYDDFLDTKTSKQQHQRRMKKSSITSSDHKLAYELQLIEDENDPLIQDLLKNGLPSSAAVRKLPLKFIDFPTAYRGVDDVNNWQWEKGRDDNFGNMVWRYASSRMLNPVSTEIDPDDTWFETSNVIERNNRRQISTLVIASANTLHLTVEPQLENLINNITQRIRYRNIPTIVLGIGIQLEFNDASQNFDLNRTDLQLTHNFQKEFLKEVSLHQKVPGIGVRGDMTRAICENSGIHNCISMGCPSLTISRDLNLGETLADNWSKVLRRLATGGTDLRIALTFPAYGGSGSSFLAVEFVCTIMEQFGKQITVIYQDKQDKDRMEEFVTQNWRQINPTTKLQVSDIQYEEYYNVESWLAGARTKYDLCISSRIHGSMVFINNGIPAVVIPTDFRIFELLHAMKIPHILPPQLEKIMKTPGATYNKLIMAVMEQATNTNFLAFETNRRNKLKGWKAILDQVGLEMDPSLLRIIRSPSV